MIETIVGQTLFIYGTGGTWVTTPHFQKCQGEPMKKAKNSQDLGKAMIIENL